MPRRELHKPAVDSWPIWKVLPLALFEGGAITFLSWGFKALGGLYRYGGSSPSLTLGDILLGCGMLLIPFWSRWAWRPRRKHARWHRWLVSLVSAIYVSVLVLLCGVASWNALLNRPWNWMVNSILIILLALAWILPVLSYSWAEKLAGAQDDLDLKMLAYGGPAGLMVLAGILGANFGMSASRNGEIGTALFAMAFGFPFVAILVAQYNAAELWSYRPWRNEEDEE